MSGTPGMSGTHGDSGMHESGMSGQGSDNVAHSKPDTVLSHNPKLDSTLTSKFQSQGLLPAGTDLKAACQGFKNLGQCVAALHVSKNLDIPFGCLQADMTGTAPATGTTCPAGTGTSKLNLGKSITTLQPSANATGEAKKANKQANSDLETASSGKSRMADQRFHPTGESRYSPDPCHPLSGTQSGSCRWSDCPADRPDKSLFSGIDKTIGRSNNAN
jgi:hypothetical protein